MKTLVFADVHLKALDSFGSVTEENGLKKEKRTFYKIETLNKIISEEKPTNVIFAGDVFDSSTPAEWLRSKFFWLIKKYRGVIFYIVTGNHDNKHTYPAGFSEAELLGNCKVVFAGDSLQTGDFNLIGYTRDDDKFRELASVKTKYLVSHRDIPEFKLDYEACFFGHVHKHYQKDNCFSIGSLFKISWAEENDDNYYLKIDENGYEFVKYEDLNLKTIRIEDRKFPDVIEYDFVRFEIVDTVDFINSFSEKEIEKKYGKKIFFKYSPIESELNLEEFEDPKEAVKELLRTKNLTEEQLNFGMKFL